MTIDGRSQSADAIRNSIKQELTTDKKMEEFITQSLEAGDYSFFDTTKNEVAAVALKTLGRMEQHVGKILEKYQEKGLDIDPGQMAKRTDGKIVNGDKKEFGSLFLDWENDIARITDGRQASMIKDFTTVLLKYWNTNIDTTMQKVDDSLCGLETNINHKIQANETIASASQAYTVESVDGISSITFSSASNAIRVDEVLTMTDEHGNALYHKGDMISIDYTGKKAGTFNEMNYIKKVGLTGTGPFELQYGEDKQGHMTLCLVKDGTVTDFRGLISDGVTVSIHPNLGGLHQEVKKSSQKKDAETRGYADILQGFPPSITTALNLSEEENKAMMIGMDKLIISSMDGLWSDRVNNLQLLNEDEPFSSSMLPGVLIEAHTTGQDGSDYAPDFITKEMLQYHMGDTLGATVYDTIDSTVGFGGHLEEFTQFLEQRRQSYVDVMRQKEVVIGKDELGNDRTERVGGFENYVEGLAIDFGSQKNANFMQQQLDWEIQNLIKKIENGSIVRPESATPFTTNGGLTGHLVDFETSGGLGGLIDASVLSSSDKKLVPGHGIDSDGVDLGHLFTLIDHGRDDKNTILVRDYLNEKWGEAYYNLLQEDTTINFGRFNGSINKPDFDNISTTQGIETEIIGLIAIIKEVADDASLNEEEKNKLLVVEGRIENGMNAYRELVLQGFLDGEASTAAKGSDAYMLKTILLANPPALETNLQARHKQTSDQLGLVANFLLTRPDGYTQEKQAIKGYLNTNERYFAVASTLGGTGAEGGFLGINALAWNQDSDDLENLLQSGSEKNMQNMIDAVPAVLTKIEMEESTPAARSKAMVDYYNDRQARIENNASQSSSYEQLASQIMKTIGSQVSEKIQGYIQQEQQQTINNTTPPMNIALVTQLKRITDIMRDNWTTANNTDTRNTFKDIAQAEANLDFLMTAPGGGMDQMKELKPTDQATESIAARSTVQSTFTTLIGGKDIAAQFSHIPGWDESMFSAPYQQLTVQQRVVVAGLSNLSERYTTAELQSLQKNHGTEAVISALMDVMNQTSNQMFVDFQADLSAWHGGGSDDAGLNGEWDNVFDSYKSLHGVGRRTLSDKNMTKMKGYAEMLGTIVVAVALAVLTVGFASQGSALLIANGVRNLVSLLVAAGKASAITTGVLTGVYMKVVGMGLGHGYENYTEGLTDIAAEGVMMGVISAASLGLGSILGKSGSLLQLTDKLKKTPLSSLSLGEKKLLMQQYGKETITKASRLAQRGPRLQATYSSAEKAALLGSTNLLFVGGMDMKQKMMTDNYMSESEFHHALMEGMVLAFLMPYLHGKQGKGLLEPLGGYKLTQKGYNGLKAKVEGMLERTLNGKNPTELSPSGKARYTGLKVLQEKLIGNPQGVGIVAQGREQGTQQTTVESISWEAQQGHRAGELLTGVDRAFNVPDRSLLPTEIKSFADGRTKPTKAQIEAVQSRIGVEPAAIDGLFGPKTLVKLTEYLEGPFLVESVATLKTRVTTATETHAQLLTKKQLLEGTIQSFSEPAPASQFNDRFNQRQIKIRELKELTKELKKAQRKLSKAQKSLTIHEKLLAESTVTRETITPKEKKNTENKKKAEERVEQKEMEQSLETNEITTQAESVSFLTGLLKKLQSRKHLSGEQAITFRQKMNNYLARLQAKYPTLNAGLNTAIANLKSFINKTILRRRARLRTQSTYSLSLFSLWETLAQSNSALLSRSMKQFRDATKPSHLSKKLIKTIQTEIGLKGKQVDGIIGPKTQAQWETYLQEAQINYTKAEARARENTQQQRVVEKPITEEIVVEESPIIIEEPIIENTGEKARNKAPATPEQVAERLKTQKTAKRLIQEMQVSIRAKTSHSLSRVSEIISKVTEFIAKSKESIQNFLKDMLALLKTLTSQLNRRINKAKTGDILKITGVIGGKKEITLIKKLANGKRETIRSSNTKLLGKVNTLSVTSSGKFQLGERTPTEGSWNISFVRNNIQASPTINAVRTNKELLAHNNVQNNPQTVKIIEKFNETGDATQLNTIANNNIKAKAKQVYKKTQAEIINSDPMSISISRKLDQLFGNQKTKNIEGVEVSRDKIGDLIQTKDITGFMSLYGNKGALRPLMESMNHEIISHITTTVELVNYISSNITVLSPTRGINGILKDIMSGKDITTSQQRLPKTLWNPINTRLPQIKSLEITHWNETITGLQTNQELVTHWKTQQDVFIRNQKPSKARLKKINQTIVEMEVAGQTVLDASVNTSLIEGLGLAA